MPESITTTEQLHYTAFMGVDIVSNIPTELMQKVLAKGYVVPGFYEWWQKQLRESLTK